MGKKISGRPGRRGTRRGRRPAVRKSIRHLQIEQLEDRIALDANGLFWQAVDATPLLLREANDQLQIVNRDAPGQVLAAVPVGAVTGGVVIEGASQDVSLTIDASVPVLPGGVLFRGGTGSNTLIGPAVDTRWHITGPGMGDLGGPNFVRFSGVDNLVGAANNRDTFCLSAAGSVAGVIDGGSGGFDSLVVDNATPTATQYTPAGPHSGTLTLGARSIRFAGLEPVTLNGPQTDVTVTGSAGDDVMNVENLSESPGMTTVSSPSSTFESLTFQTPSHSLTVTGGGGYDQINVVNALNLGNADFIATSSGSP